MSQSMLPSCCDVMIIIIGMGSILTPVAIYYYMNQDIVSGSNTN